MVHSNKILTVSYGTFSCTLEGFDDSFGTMKAIAEYFRDLAAQDRYFGAEPPQPDAEMLARIAQREISHTVEARTDSQGIVLRARELTAAAQAPAEPAHAVTPTQPVQETSEPDSVTPPLRVATLAGDSIAAKLQRIRAVVSQNETAAQQTEYSEDEHADAFVTTAAADVTIASQHEDDDIDDNLDAAPAPEADELSSILDRMDAEPDEPADVLETPPLPQTDAEPEPELLDAGRDEDGNEEDGVEVADAESVTAETLSDDEDEDDQAAEDDENDALFGDLDDDDEDWLEDEDDDEHLNIILEPETSDHEESEAEGEAAESDAVAPRRPRVLKVRRAELDAAIAAGDLEEIDDEDEAALDETGPQEEDADATGHRPGTLSAEEEADLRRELAALEAELGATEAGQTVSDAAPATETDDETDTQDDMDAPDQPVAAHRKATLPSGGEDEEDISRLMEAAKSRMKDSETASSRETYSHLRGAVAAAEAERSAGGSVDSPIADEAYRDDLASVVRPRRPVAAGSDRAARPVADARPAPLKLVAEQRVDTAEPQAARGPVRPRRISTASIEDSPAAESGQGGFVAFAEEMGATELPDLLEAAAAYMSFVEGREQFSRPQLMNRVRQVEAGDFNREDGLRSFGKLLREGKIEKTGGGRFTVSGDIGFRPDERAVG